MKERKKEALAVCCNIHAIEIGLLLNGLLCNLVCTGVKNLPPFLPFSSLSLTFPESLDFFFFLHSETSAPFPCRSPIWLCVSKHTERRPSQHGTGGNTHCLILRLYVFKWHTLRRPDGFHSEVRSYSVFANDLVCLPNVKYQREMGVLGAPFALLGGSALAPSLSAIKPDSFRPSDRSRGVKSLRVIRLSCNGRLALSSLQRPCAVPSQ